MFQRRSRAGRALVTGGVAGCAVLCAGALPAVAQQPAPPCKLVIDPVSVTIHTGNPAVMRYRYAEVPFKPYVDFLATPSGVNILLDSPPDHKHHHGLMFAVGVDGVNFWEEVKDPGVQAHDALDDVRSGMGGDIRYGGFVDGIVWVNPATKAPLLTEARRLEVVAMKDQKASLLTWESLLSLPPEKKSAALGGSDYFGLGMRFVPSMDTGGTFLSAEGKTGVEATNATRANWCAYSAKANGKPVTVAVFSHPENSRPVTWFTMEKPFPYLSATLNLKKEPLTLSGDRPLLLRYGVALWDGATDPKDIESLYRRWADLFKPPPGQPGTPGQPGRPTEGGAPPPAGGR